MQEKKKKKYTIILPFLRALYNWKLTSLLYCYMIIVRLVRGE